MSKQQSPWWLFQTTTSASLTTRLDNHYLSTMGNMKCLGKARVTQGSSRNLPTRLPQHPQTFLPPSVLCLKFHEQRRWAFISTTCLHGFQRSCLSNRTWVITFPPFIHQRLIEIPTESSVLFSSFSIAIENTTCALFTFFDLKMAFMEPQKSKNPRLL